MLAVAFDTLKLAQRLRDEVKFTPEQSEKAAAVLADTFSDWHNQLELATKSDLGITKTELKTDLAVIKADLTAALAETKAELIKWVVGIGFAQIAMILAVLKIHN